MKRIDVPIRRSIALLNNIKRKLVSRRNHRAARFTLRGKLLLRYFFPGIALFLWVGWDEAWYAYEIGETSEQTAWRPLLWPLKACIPAAAALLLLQGVSELAKSLYAWSTGTEYEQRFKAET